MHHLSSPVIHPLLFPDNEMPQELNLNSAGDHWLQKAVDEICSCRSNHRQLALMTFYLLRSSELKLHMLAWQGKKGLERRTQRGFLYVPYATPCTGLSQQPCEPSPTTGSPFPSFHITQPHSVQVYPGLILWLDQPLWSARTTAASWRHGSLKGSRSPLSLWRLGGFNMSLKWISPPPRLFYYDNWWPANFSFPLSLKYVSLPLKMQYFF